ncbi:nickel pincer cofactor biosynthesis protein LarC [Actinomycetospora lutea]|uniref:nickel pincer cofactor biosynthesis protein LarC n=1 Tax=Actinomycetospora lutea TaxID=663604 RepID=UPI002365E16C|nr:nickel pincer cofactor biosynthesis protein LarC [Actinomycetospora lutea]MDD7938300.1 nickel pincer cofactor biosynthesis protein LarC [Actinomycetospora lutea]
MGEACWVDATAGVAGDMLLAALVDAGADEDRVRAAVASLGVPGLAVHTDTDRRGGLRCRRAHVTAPGDDPTHRHLAAILPLVDRSALSGRAADAARRTFTLLAEAEAAVHGTSSQNVTLHEVGAHDALADVVGVVAAADDLGLLADGAAVVCSPLAAGSGTVRAAHGRLPVPVPAVVELAARHGLALGGDDLAGERTTPTGAALLAALARPGSFPALTVRAVGVGGGARDTPDRPNVTRVVLGAAPVTDAVRTGEVVVLEATVDDLDPQLWPAVLEAVRAAGAWDCWTSPIVARHGRPGHVLSAVCDEAVRPAVADAVFRHTTTIGLRWSSRHRATLPRRAVTVRVGAHEIAVKIAQLGDGTERAKPEIADVEAAARALGLPAAEVAERARRALRSS